MTQQAANSTDISRTLETVERLHDIGAEAWRALSGADVDAEGYNPFVSFAFLSSLEDSGSAVADTGWIGSHLVLRGEKDAVSGVMPAYLKLHSQGEYVFDYAWADAYERAGGRYYPKLQSSIPFTPASAPKLLTAQGEAFEDVAPLLARGAQAVTEKLGLSSAHVTFVDERERQTLEGAGYMARHDQQFHWRNDGYASFAQFEDALASRKRKQLRRERRDALANGIEIRWHTGADLTEAQWDAFWVFYQDTGARKWGRPYLTRSFFSMIGERMADQIILMLAYRDGRPIAGALNFLGEDTLFGRHWGCTEHHPFLHFELCYYQAIDYAIAHKLGRVEAGAQGAHKLARGYTPVVTTSMHHIPHAGFRDAVKDYLDHEREQVLFDAQYLEGRTPFKSGGGN
ncbi:MAG: N-acetyltransferase [Devosiaceae bacterium]|nr:N-acetyltransferase [Devosiaceae bacterium MH13]